MLPCWRRVSELSKVSLALCLASDVFSGQASCGSKQRWRKLRAFTSHLNWGEHAKPVSRKLGLELHLL